MLFENIETDRLILKNICSEDRECIFSQFSDDVVNRYLFDADPLTDISGADEIIEFYLEPEPRMQHRWIVIRKIDGIKMCTCGFHCWDQEEGKVEVGYDLKEEFWGNGYMQEAMKGILSFAKHKMKVREIKACIYINNEKSIRLVENLGFILTGTSYEILNSKKYLHNVYTLYFSPKNEENYPV